MPTTMIVELHPIVNCCNQFHLRSESVPVVVLVLEGRPQRFGAGVVPACRLRPSSVATHGHWLPQPGRRRCMGCHDPNAESPLRRGRCARTPPDPPQPSPTRCACDRPPPRQHPAGVLVTDGTQVHVSFTAAQIFDTNSAMIAATVLAETRSPSSCRSAVILGDSYVPPEAS